MSKVLMYVGCCNGFLPYVKSPAGKGIAAFEVDTGTGVARPLGMTEGIDNPTFVAVSPDGKSLTAVSEYAGDKEGLLTAYAVDRATGGLRLLNRVSSAGATPAHLDYDATGGFVGAANYHDAAPPAETGVSLIVLRRGDDGALSERVGVATHAGSGPDIPRQDRSHAHCVRWTPDNRFLAVADLGIDKLVVYRFDAATGAIARHGDVAMPAGAGPRHFAFHPNGRNAYVVDELDSTVVSLSFDAANGSFKQIGVASTLPSDWSGENSCSAIQFAPGTTYLFAGNRGHNSVARFKIDGDGVAQFAGTTSSGGSWPRDFAFDPTGTLLAVANQEGNVVALLRHKDGKLSPLGEIATGTPTGIAFHPQVQ